MRFARFVLFVFVLASAFGLPYLLMQDNLSQTATDLWDTIKAKVAAGRGNNEGALDSLDGGSSFNQDLTARKVAKMRELAKANIENPEQMPYVGGPQVDSPGELFRFDVTPNWIIQNWARVTRLKLDGLDMFRVPVMTGTDPHDIVGSITYSFSVSRQLQRVQFDGSSSDPSVLAQAVARYYGLTAKQAIGGTVYSSEHEGQTHSLILVHYGTAIRKDDTRRSHEISIELNRPASEYGVTEWLDLTVKDYLQRTNTREPTAPAEPPVSEEKTKESGPETAETSS